MPVNMLANDQLRCSGTIDIITGIRNYLLKPTMRNRIFKTHLKPGCIMCTSEGSSLNGCYWDRLSFSEMDVNALQLLAKPLPGKFKVSMVALPKELCSAPVLSSGCQPMGTWKAEDQPYISRTWQQSGEPNSSLVCAPLVHQDPSPSASPPPCLQ